MRPQRIGKEYFNSTATGDYVCRVCGKAFWNGDKGDEDEKIEKVKMIVITLKNKNYN